MFNCNSDDDGGDGSQLSNKELLQSGKWYQESKTPGNLSACEKKGFIEFKSNGDFIINSYEDNSGTCTAVGMTTAGYTLTNDVNITIVLGSDSIAAVIKSITSTKLTITTTEEGEASTQVFDKTEG